MSINTEDLKRVTRQAFVEHFNIGSDAGSVSGGDVFHDAAPDPEEELMQNQAATENIDEIEKEIDRNKAARRQRTAEEMDKMLEETTTFFEQHSSREKRNSSKGNITGGERTSNYKTVVEEAPRNKEQMKRLSTKQHAQAANNKRREREAKVEDKQTLYPQPEEAQGELPPTRSTKGTAASSSGYAQAQPEQTFTFTGFRIVAPSKVTVGIMRDTLEGVCKSELFDMNDGGIYEIIRGGNGKFAYLAKGTDAEQLRATEELKRLYRRYVWSHRVKA